MPYLLALLIPAVVAAWAFYVGRSRKPHWSRYKPATMFMGHLKSLIKTMVVLVVGACCQDLLVKLHQYDLWAWALATTAILSLAAVPLFAFTGWATAKPEAE